MPIRVFLLDDHEIVRRGLRELLEGEDDIVVVGEADTAEIAVGRIPATNPDVAVLDVQLPDGDGIEVCREVRSRRPELVCLMLTSYADDEALLASVMAGAVGFVLKQVRGNDIVDAVRRAAAGESLLEPAVVDRMMRQFRDAESQLDALTPQERKIFDLIGQGYTNRQIGDELQLAEKTVKNYVSNLFVKMGVHRRTEVAAYAARLDERRRHFGG